MIAYCVWTWLAIVTTAVAIATGNDDFWLPSLLLYAVGIASYRLALAFDKARFGDGGAP